MNSGLQNLSIVGPIPTPRVQIVPGVLVDPSSLSTTDACFGPQGICAEVSFEYLLSIPPEATDVVT
jgi:hypothetical protein